MDVRMQDGTIIKNVPEGTTQEELLRRYEALSSSAKQPGIMAPKQSVDRNWFPGSAFVNKPTPEEVTSAINIPRQAFWDTAFGPSQVAAGLIDYGDAALRKAGLDLPPGANLSQAVSRARNTLGGREGTEAGPATGFLQAISTAPAVGVGNLRAVLQGVGLGSGLAAPGESQFSEGNKGGATALVANTVGRMFGRREPTSIAERQLRQTANKENIDMTMGTQTGSPLMKEVERRAERNLLLGGVGTKNFATATRERIDDQFAEAVWRRIGMTDDIATKYKVKFNEFNDKTFKAANESLGEVFQKPFKNGPIEFRGPELLLATKRAEFVSRDMADPTLVNQANALIKKKMAQGKLSDNERTFLMNELRSMRERAFGDQNKNINAGEAIDDLMTAINSTVVRNIKNETDREAYMAAMKKWANLKVIEDVFVRSNDSARGNLDFTKIKGAIERGMPGGYTYGRADMADLANLGMAMRGGGVMPEGMKINFWDPLVYGAFNSPLSMQLRKSGPVSDLAMTGMLRAVAAQMNQE